MCMLRLIVEWHICKSIQCELLQIIDTDLNELSSRIKCDWIVTLSVELNHYLEFAANLIKASKILVFLEEIWINVTFEPDHIKWRSHSSIFRIGSEFRRYWTGCKKTGEGLIIRGCALPSMRLYRLTRVRRPLIWYHLPDRSVSISRTQLAFFHQGWATI